MLVRGCARLRAIIWTDQTTRTSRKPEFLLGILLLQQHRNRKEEVPDPNGQEIRIFVCGPTVYDYAHLGHARTYLAVDTMVRYLRFRGYRPFVLMNITDIDEHVIKKSEETGRSAQEIASEFENRSWRT